MNIQYPEIYYKVYPKVQKCILRYYPPYLPIYKLPNEEQFTTMIDEIYDEMIEEYPEIAEAMKERKSRNASMQSSYYGRGGLFKSLIWIILLRTLLGKKSPYYGPGCGPGHGPGYGPGCGPGYGPRYGPGYGPGYDPGYGPGYRK